ncbi:MAG TPA: PASTA domain-containing protein [Ignavibacteria bacterium]|nr:PASTA domain-containing protein [Ignavibacteria bacterium]
MKFWKKLLIGIAGLFVAILLMNFIVMPWYVRHDTLVKVPAVVGLSYEEAKKQLDDAGLEGLQGDIRYDPSKPIGTVVDQNPPADQTVKDGRRIYLIISGGEQLYDVPNLVGRTLREAKFMLDQRNLEVQEVEYKPSAQYPSGIVLAQIENAGSKVKKDTRIGVIVSTGMDAGDIKVPDLTGKNLEEAKKLLAVNKLTLGKVNYQPSTNVPLNAVIDQYPKSNTMAKENQKIDVFVNRENKKKIVIEGEEDGLKEKEEEIQPDNNDFKDDSKKDDKKNDKKDDVKSKPTDKDKKGDVKTKPTDKKSGDKKDEKKTTPQPKNDKDKKDGTKKNDGGTNF